MQRSGRTHLSIAVVVSLLIAASGTWIASVTAPAAHAAVSPTLAWQRDISGRLQLSAPTIADVNQDGSNDIVVGDLEGWVHVYRGDGLAEIPGWPQRALVDGVHATAVDSPPAVADLDRDGHPEIIVGATSVWAPNQQGGLVVFNANGTLRWHWQGIDYITIWGQTSFRHDGYTEGSVSAPAIGDVDGDGYPDIVFGTFEARIHALSRNGIELRGFPYQADDTVWSSASLFDVDHDGRDEIFIGSPSTGGGPQPHMGGTMFALDWRNGTVATLWRNNISESIDAAPAIADIDRDGRMDVVTTTGWAFQNVHSQSVFAWHLDDGSAVAGWPVNTGAITAASVAIGDLDRDNRPEVIVASWDGRVRAYGGNGKLMWNVDAFHGASQRARIEAGPLVADLDGDGYQDIVVPTDINIELLRGIDGTSMSAPVGLMYSYFASPAVGMLNGRWSIVATGFRGGYPTPESDPTAVGRISVFRFGTAPLSTHWSSFHNGSSRRGVFTATVPPQPSWRCSQANRGASSPGQRGKLVNTNIPNGTKCGAVPQRSS